MQKENEYWFEFKWDDLGRGFMQNAEACIQKQRVLYSVILQRLLLIM